MKNYHVIVNGSSAESQIQMEEALGFVKSNLQTDDIKPGNLYIYGKDGAPYTQEQVLAELEKEVQEEDLYVFGNGEENTAMAVRLAARCHGSSVTDVQAVESSWTDSGIAVRKMVYANHMEALFQMEKGPYCISLARGMEREKEEMAALEEKSIICKGEAAYIVSREFHPKEDEEGLEHAKVVVAAGRGVGKKDNMEILDKVAGKLGGKVVVSRPAAMNAWKPMNRLIGVSGAMISPDICITAGVSGAAAFYAGVEKSKFIVAINNDEHAPIMKMADVAVADDFLPIMEELDQILEDR